MAQWEVLTIATLEVAGLSHVSYISEKKKKKEKEILR